MANPGEEKEKKFWGFLGAWFFFLFFFFFKSEVS